ncbi:hypothetical protein VTN00DRAFT_3370 [Thermoascus crustaceus]|uniref:uncharacterized protein n=1 Tax=Thermoascus crustaceus TaxID=5088 RepID=UPI00374395A1
MAVAELVTFLPMRWGIFEFGNRYLDPAVGFAFGWAYFYAAAMLFCTELSPVATVMGYWVMTTNAAVWIAMALVCLLLNIFAVKYYGESEFIFSAIKALLIIGLVLLTFITMVGGNPKHDAYGFRYWKNGNALHEYYATGSLGRFLGWWTCMRYAASSIGGPDVISLAAGEIVNPRRTVPRMAELVFYRPRSPLARGFRLWFCGICTSPWVIGIKNLGINGLAGFINLLILTAAFLYTSSRTLYSLVLEGQAPKFLRKCMKNGIPIYCVLAVALVSCVTFMVSSTASATVFEWFIGLSTCAIIIVYILMLVIWFGFYKSLKAQGISRDSLPWRAPLMPYGCYLGLVIGLLLLIFLGFDVFVPWSTQGFVTTYFGIACVLVLFLFWKVYKRTRLVNFKEVDIFAGKEEIDRV